MAREETPVYRCTQLELYSICETAISNLEANLSSFADFKTKYDATYVASIKQQRIDAMALPDSDVRDAVSESMRVELLPIAAKCVKYYQFLKGYIDDAFVDDMRTIKYRAAGLDEYAKAKESNWEDLVGMNSKMIAFINENASLLASAGFMPATFPANVQSASEEFATKYAAFKLARQTSQNTVTKIKANNALYKSVMDFMTDGVMLMSGREDMKRLFTFGVLKSLVSPPGSASLRVSLKNSDSTAAADVNVIIRLSDGSGSAKNTKSDANGDAIFSGIDAGVYDVSVEYTPVQNYVKEVNTGVAARMEVVKS